MKTILRLAQSTRTWCGCARSSSQIRTNRNTSSRCMEPATGSSVRTKVRHSEEASDMENVMPRSRIKMRAPNNHHTWSSQQAPGTTYPSMTASVPTQEEIDSLLQERLELHAQLFEAAQIQRKLGG